MHVSYWLNLLSLARVFFKNLQSPSFLKTIYYDLRLFHNHDSLNCRCLIGIVINIHNDC